MRWRSLLLAVTAALLPVGAPSVAAQEPETATAIVLSPQEGQQLFGPENISGSAYHTTAFDSYTLEYDDLTDAEVRWLLVQPVVRQQVRDGVLGTWNTTFVPDGVYRLRLRVFTSDGQAAEHVVGNLRVANAEPTPVPTSAPAVLPAVPTPGPSPTSPIVQPPSSNPSLDVLTNPEAFEEPIEPALGTGPARRSTRVNVDRIRGAFCSGVYLAAAAFAVVALYTGLTRRRLRAWQPGPSNADDWPDEP